MKKILFIAVVLLAAGCSKSDWKNSKANIAWSI